MKTVNLIPKKLIWLGAIALFIACACILTSNHTNGLGFPLDDAWIHQTYARNLVLYGQWVFTPGVLSAGSTSPLWTVVLAIGYLLRINPYFWTFLLGGICIYLIGGVGEMIFGMEFPWYAHSLPWVGLFLIGEWHLVWAAFSGMETLLFSLVIVGVFLLLLSGQPRWGLIGLIIGLAVWIRPDGITLLGPVLFTIWLKQEPWGQKIRNTIALIPGVGFCIIGYFWFNHSLSGTWMPNTFYAKQLEYGVYQHISWLERWFSLIKQPFIGAGVILVPGFIYEAIISIKSRNWVILAGILWVVGYLTLYSFSLPVFYQHGRYQIPVMPLCYIISIIGFKKLIDNHLFHKRYFVVKTVWLFSLAVAWISFLTIGIKTYATDVAIINTEMVNSALWINTNTNKDAKIAAHDIGALGYFGEREIIDLAGLVSPQVIPFIRDEGRLATFLDSQKVDYLMTFPGWYPQLIKQGNLVYKTGSTFSPEQGGENMQIYKWKNP
jgi:hypothetical protein